MLHKIQPVYDRCMLLAEHTPFISVLISTETLYKGKHHPEMNTVTTI